MSMRMLPLSQQAKKISPKLATQTTNRDAATGDTVVARRQRISKNRQYTEGKNRKGDLERDKCKVPDPHICHTPLHPNSIRPRIDPENFHHVNRKCAYEILTNEYRTQSF